MTHSILKCCPFCGEQLKVNNANLAAHPRFSDCLFAQQVVVVDDPAQMAKWNTRAQPAGDPKPVEDAQAFEIDVSGYTKMLSKTMDKAKKTAQHYRALGHLVSIRPLFTRPAPAGVVDMLRKALPFLEQHNDQGPTGEGWQSDELTDLVNAITVELNGAPK